MKNHSNNSENFILNYKIVNDEIIINFASIKGKDKYSVPYTIENEKKILEKMKNQILSIRNSWNSDYEKLLKLESSFKMSFIFLGISVLIISSFIFNIVPINYYLIDSLIAVSCLSKFIFSTSKYVNFNSKLKDLGKNRAFLETEDIINEALKNNQSILSGTKVKIKDLSLNRENPILDINKIDRISSKDLAQIIENAKFENDLKLDYSNDANEKSKVLVKKIK